MKGDTGARGPAGPRGERGERGRTGPRGPAGELPEAVRLYAPALVTLCAALVFSVAPPSRFMVVVFLLLVSLGFVVSVRESMKRWRARR